jgi:hypothetical protein
MGRSVYAVDVDGDGDMDVLSASSVDDKIAWYENDGQQTFTSHTITTSADAATSVYATDMDGDGDMDVLSASFGDDKIAWYENDGQQTSPAHTLPPLQMGLNPSMPPMWTGMGIWMSSPHQVLMTKLPGTKTTASIRPSPAIPSPPLQMGLYPFMSPMLYTPTPSIPVAFDRLD